MRIIFIIVLNGDKIVQLPWESPSKKVIRTKLIKLVSYVVLKKLNEMIKTHIVLDLE